MLFHDWLLLTNPLCVIFLWPRETGTLGYTVDSSGLKKGLSHHLRCRLPAVQCCHSFPCPSMRHYHMAQCGFTIACDSLVSLGLQITMFRSLHACSWSCSNKTRPHQRACLSLGMMNTSWSACGNVSSKFSISHFPIRVTFMWHPRILHKFPS